VRLAPCARYGAIGTTDKLWPPFPPSPPSPPPSPPPPLGNYTKHAGRNCYDGHGARSLDGGGVGPLSAPDCERRCDADAACDCVTYQPGASHCWKRAACVPAQFEQNGGYDVYVKAGGITVPVEAGGRAPGLSA
jgi:hypothetical protein